METIPLEALKEIVKRGMNGPMFKHEMVKMAAELIDLRARFNRGEDKVDDWSEQFEGWGKQLYRAMKDLAIGNTLIMRWGDITQIVMRKEKI